MSSNYLLTMQGRNGIRIWVHEGKYRIQKRMEPMPDRNGNPQEAWESLTENEQVLLFGTWQEAEKHIHANNIT
jgi:hypothetical protein